MPRRARRRAERRAEPLLRAWTDWTHSCKPCPRGAVTSSYAAAATPASAHWAA